jgi:hypothetical protein
VNVTTLPDAPLASLAAQINEAHRQCVAAASSALEHARRAGTLLAEAKGKCGHGQWLPWLKENFDFSERTAQNYMKVAREWPRLAEANPQRVADLSYREAVKLLEAPRQPKDGEPTLPEMREGFVYRAVDDDGRLAEIVPLGDVFYVAVYTDLDTDSACVQYARRGVFKHGIAEVLAFSDFVPAGGWQEEPRDGKGPPWPASKHAKWQAEGGK